MADWWPERTKPRAVQGGVKAQTQRGAMGKAWWSKRFLEAIERLDPGSRLQRGRTYARKGQVADLDVRPGRVTARVQGSRPKPYTVTITWSLFDDGSWAEVGEALRADPLIGARILNGELPEEVVAIFEAAEASLFPVRRGELQTACSCPDWSNPCKHVAAVFYLLAERLDQDPFLLLLVRGATRERLTGLLVAQAPQAPEGDPLGASGDGAPPLAVRTAADAFPDDPSAFWAAGEAPQPPAPTPPPAPLPLVRRLGPFPFWRGRAPLLDTLLR